MRIRPAALILENNHILLLSYHYEAGTKFGLPGGNVDSGENFDQTVRRELEEELGIEVEVGEMIAVGQVHATTDYEACLHIIFEADIVGGIPQLQPDETTANEVVWVPVAKMAELNIYPAITNAILDFVHSGKKGQYMGTLKQIWF